MQKTLREEQVDKLLRDAIYWHLIGKGYSEYRAKVEADRRMAIRRSLKGNKI